MPDKRTAARELARDFITVVSGVPRSGTSLAMQMIVAGGIAPCTDAARAPDEDNPRGYFELERVKSLRTDKAWVGDARGHCVKVIHLLLPELPEAFDYRIVLVERDLEEVVRSQAAMLARIGRTGGGLAPERLVAAYAAQLAQVVAHLATRPRCAVLRVAHADLIRVPERAAAEIARFLGGGLDEQSMVAAVDPTLYRNRRG